MKFIADLHIHSHHSLATSGDLVPEYLDAWAQLKGIQVMGTGDFIHPGWYGELCEKLAEAEPGLFKLKAEHRLDADTVIVPPTCAGEVRFMLTAGYYSGADIWWNPFGQGTYGIHDLTGLLDGCRDD